MNSGVGPIPLVDLQLLHQPLQPQIEQAMRAVMARGDYILGQEVAQFEAEFACACGAAFGVGVASGTDAIALGLQACGVGLGDEVIVPANTFAATLIGVQRAGATPVLVDCDQATALIDLASAAQAITPRTKAIMPVHLYGQMVSPHALWDLASAHNLLIFEDAAQAHLAEREGYRAGSVGTAAAFSFYPSKNLGALGDGGLVVTRDAAIADRLRSLRNYGAPLKYCHVDHGTNSRLDTLQAAVLRTKLPYLAGWNGDRQWLASVYDAALADLAPHGILPIQNHSGRGHVYHLYVIRVTDACICSRERLQARLADAGIQTGIHYPIPCHLQPAFAALAYENGAFPHAEQLSRQILSLPLYPGLGEADVARIVNEIAHAVSPASLCRAGSL